MNLGAIFLNLFAYHHHSLGDFLRALKKFIGGRQFGASVLPDKGKVPFRWRTQPWGGGSLTMINLLSEVMAREPSPHGFKSR